MADADWQRRWNAANPEKVRAARERYKLRNRAKLKAKALQRYYARHAENKAFQTVRARVRRSRRGGTVFLGCPRSYEGWIKHLRSWGGSWLVGTTVGERVRSAMDRHDAWLCSLDEEEGLCDGQEVWGSWEEQISAVRVAGRGNARRASKR